MSVNDDIRPLRGVAMVLGLGVAAAAASCLGANDAHCMYGGGDLQCGSRICVFAPRRAEGRAVGVPDDGCYDGATAPEGFMPIPYGLPRRLEADGDGDLASVEGLLQALVGEDVTAQDLDELRAATDSVTPLRSDYEDEKTPTINELDDDGLGRVRTYTQAIDDWLDRHTSTSTDTETDTDTDGESEDTSAGTVGETTGPMPCERHEQCTEPLLPLCGPDGLCVSCDELPEPDAACAELDPMAPLCVGGQCVQCSEQDATACDGMLCDAETNSCYPCSAHDQCGEAACNLFTGQCLPPDEVVHVGPGFLHDRIDDAVATFNSPGDQGTIIVHGSGVYSDQFVVIGNAQTIAILADDGDLPRWIQSTAVPHLRVVVDATVLVDGMQISGSPGGPGVEVDGGRLWIDRGRIIQNNGAASWSPGPTTSRSPPTWCSATASSPDPLTGMRYKSTAPQRWRQCTPP
ncbi:MAG: hypothetical protein H6712_23975 [Myxococcales bacterium]|nr:hypothetical protein [Myxococcales bacterium]